MPINKKMLMTMASGAGLTLFARQTACWAGVDMVKETLRFLVYAGVFPAKEGDEARPLCSTPTSVILVSVILGAYIGALAAEGVAKLLGPIDNNNTP